MKPPSVLMLLFAFGAALPASANSLMLDFGNPTANTSTPETSTSSPGPVATGTYLTLSPGHAIGAVALGETTWNTITTSSPRSDLSYSDGTSATGVTLTLGQESSAGSNTIDYTMPITTLNLIGNGGGTAGRKNLLTPGSIYGDSRLESSAVGRDGFFGGTGSAIGFRVDGLAEGIYKIHLMGRNTNSNTTSLQGMTFHASAGAPSATFANFNSAASASQANTSYSTAAYTNQYESFAEGQNYVVLTVSIGENESLFVAVDGTDTELRGFLNMAQIVPAAGTPDPFTWSMGDGDWDTTSLNWNGNTAAYSEPALVTFPTLADEVDGVNTVNLTDEFSPFSLSITNTGDFDTTAYAFTGSGAITGETGITKSGSGIVRFSAANNSYSGNLDITAGAVVKDVADATTGDITVANGATFVLQGGITDGDGQTATLTGPGHVNFNYFYEGSANQRGALQAQSGANTWAGDIILLGTTGTGGNTRIGVQEGASLLLTGSIFEAAPGMSPYFRAGNSPADVITLAGDCLWTGPTRIYSNGGIVTITSDDKLPTTASLIVGPTDGATGSPTFDLAGYNQTVAGLSGSGGAFPAVIMNTGFDRSTLTVNPSDASNYAGGVWGDVELVIGGSAAQTLSGSNSHFGDTLIGSGANLIVADSGTVLLYPAEDGITNSIGGSGSLQYDGKLWIDTLGADATPGNSWTLVHVGGLAGASFGPTFSICDSWDDEFVETSENSGIWKLVDGEIVWTFSEATGTLSVGLDGADPFGEWIASHFPGETDPAIIGRSADPDGDGISNIAEFALNGAPDNGADTGYQVAAIEDTDANSQNELTLTIAVRKAGGSPVFAGSPLSAISDGVRYTIEGSLDLAFPTSATSEASPASGPAGLPADYEYRRFRLDASDGLAGKGFLRVKIEEAP